MTCDISVEQLALATGSTPANARLYHGHLVPAMRRFEIDTPLRQAAFLATLAVESQALTAVSEGLHYRDPARLARILPRKFKTTAEAAPYTRNPDALSALLYDGYHGRGLIQLTWLKNYVRARDALGFDYVKNPALLTQPEHAALSAAWFWDDAGCNRPADRADMREVTRRVNGPALLHLAERTAQFAVARKVLGC